MAASAAFRKHLYGAHVSPVRVICPLPTEPYGRQDERVDVIVIQQRYAEDRSDPDKARAALHFSGFVP